jgi:hypothetical protein
VYSFRLFAPFSSSPSFHFLSPCSFFTSRGERREERRQDIYSSPSWLLCFCISLCHCLCDALAPTFFEWTVLLSSLSPCSPFIAYSPLSLFLFLYTCFNTFPPPPYSFFIPLSRRSLSFSTVLQLTILQFTIPSISPVYLETILFLFPLGCHSDSTLTLKRETPKTGLSHSNLFISFCLYATHHILRHITTYYDTKYNITMHSLP